MSYRKCLICEKIINLHEGSPSQYVCEECLKKADSTLYNNQPTKTNKFWIIMREDYSDGYKNIPTKQHQTKESAMLEANRLCAKEGKSFFVLECVGEYECKKEIIFKEVK